MTGAACRLLHRPEWIFERRKLTGPDLLGSQRHVGVYRCARCDARQTVIGGRVRPEDASLGMEAHPPSRGAAMRIHEILGGR
jgi:hypothetical protein